MSNWTPTLLAERLQEAASVLRRLPPVKGTGSFSFLRTYFSDFVDLLPPLPKNARTLPTPAEISRMEETLDWTVGLEPVDAKIVWMRAYRIRWKNIYTKFGLSRASAELHWFYALALIAGRLNGRPFPQHLSRNRVMAIARRRQEQQESKNRECQLAHETYFV